MWTRRIAQVGLAALVSVAGCAPRNGDDAPSSPPATPPPPPPPPAPSGAVGPTPQAPAWCVVEEGVQALPDEVDKRPVYRVLPSGEVTPRAPGAQPLDGPVAAAIEGGSLVVRRGGLAILAATGNGAEHIAWQIERKGVLYLSLARGGGQTHQALRLSAAPHVSTVWCRRSPTSGGQAPPTPPEKARAPGESGPSPAGSGSGETKLVEAAAAATGDLLVKTEGSLLALRPDDGSLAWQVPWPDIGSSPPSARLGRPFKPLAADKHWLFCDRESVALRRDTGAVQWRHRHDTEPPTECFVVGRRLLYRSHCGVAPCTPDEAGAIDVETGKTLWSTSSPIGIPLVARDGEHLLFAVGNGVALFSARTTWLSDPLALPTPPLEAQSLPGGNALLHGASWTARVAVAPLAGVWAKPYAPVVEHAGWLFAFKAKTATSAASLVQIDLTSGAERAFALPVNGKNARGEVIGVSAQAIDVRIVSARPE